jgi:hypothetical protein
MKTTSQTTRPLPKPVRFSLYIGAVAALCFLNWVALPAQGTAKSFDSHLAAAFVEEVETEVELESWMLNVSDDFMTANDIEIELESWMLNVSDEFMTASDTEIEFESWMLTIARDIIVEDWMTNTLLWDTVFLLAWK